MWLRSWFVVRHVAEAVCVAVSVELAFVGYGAPEKRHQFFSALGRSFRPELLVQLRGIRHAAVGLVHQFLFRAAKDLLPAEAVRGYEKNVAGFPFRAGGGHSQEEDDEGAKHVRSSEVWRHETASVQKLRRRGQNDDRCRRVSFCRLCHRWKQRSAPAWD
jgi:hypothetical protein